MQAHLLQFHRDGNSRISFLRSLTFPPSHPHDGGWKGIGGGGVQRAVLIQGNFAGLDAGPLGLFLAEEDAGMGAGRQEAPLMQQREEDSVVGLHLGSHPAASLGCKGGHYRVSALGRGGEES